MSLPGLGINRVSVKTICLVVILFPQLSSCITGGTHGSIKGYEYPVSKYVLQNAVEKVIRENPNIQPDTVVNFSVDITDGKNDTIYSNRYNDKEHYRRISIPNVLTGNSYTIHYLGDTTYWNTSKTSEISISYAYDVNGNGGSEGRGDFPWYKPSLRKKLVGVFEKEFVSKLDMELGIKHTDTD